MIRAPQVHTLQSLTARCEDEGPCLIWPGVGPTRKKIARPMIHHDGVRQSVRRLFAILRGDPLALAEETGRLARAYWGVSCGDLHCMAAEHTVRRSKHEQYKMMRKRANTGATNMIRIARITRTQRAKVGKLSPAQIDTIVSSPDSHETEASRHGVSKALIARMRRRDVSTQAGSIFSGLGGRS